MDANKLHNKKLSLPVILDISTVLEWHNTLILNCDNRDFIAISCADNTKIHSPGIQLLVSLLKTTQKDGGQLIVDDVPNEMRDALQDFGLLETIQKWGRHDDQARANG